MANIPEKVLRALKTSFGVLFSRFRLFKKLQKEAQERERQPKWHSVADYAKYNGIEGRILTVPQAVAKTRLRVADSKPTLFFEQEYQSIQKLRDTYNIVDYGHRLPRKSQNDFPRNFKSGKNKKS